jgi:hypothetical protein
MVLNWDIFTEAELEEIKIDLKRRIDAGIPPTALDVWLGNTWPMEQRTPKERKDAPLPITEQEIFADLRQRILSTAPANALDRIFIRAYERHAQAEDPWLPVSEVAAGLECSERTVRRWTQRRYSPLPSAMVDGVLCVRSQEAKTWIRGNARVTLPEDRIRL